MSGIIRKEELQRNLETARLWVDAVAAALNVLNPEERKVLERFYICEERGAAESLAGDLCADVKTVYRKKDYALWKFTVALYGA